MPLHALHPLHPDSSARRTGPHGLQALAHETAAALRERVQREGQRHWDLVCVTEADGRLVGTLTPSELLALAPHHTLGRAARRDAPRVSPGTDQEHMASLALHHHATAMPVVDDDGRLVGVVGAATLMNILRREHVEDLHRLAGIAREPGEAEQARQALTAPPLRRARHRLPWLLVGLAGSMVATYIVSRFEATLEARPMLAFFVPGLVYLADAIGTQTEAVAVRGLSLSRQPLGRMLAAELRTGLLMGLVLGLLALPMIWLVFGDLALATAVALALGGASMVATGLGLLLPWGLTRLGLDPAYGSGPLATIVQDLLSLLIYFGCVTAVVL
jgi:magnesium transporter